MSEKVVGTILQRKSEKEREEKELNFDEADAGQYTRYHDDDSRSFQSVGRFRPGRHNYDDGDSNIDDDGDDGPIIDLQSGEQDYSW